MQEKIHIKVSFDENTRVRELSEREIQVLAEKNGIRVSNKDTQIFLTNDAYGYEVRYKQLADGYYGFLNNDNPIGYEEVKIVGLIPEGKVLRPTILAEWACIPADEILADAQGYEAVLIITKHSGALEVPEREYLS